MAALILISATGPAVIGQDLRMLSTPELVRLGDLAVLLSLVLVSGICLASTLPGDERALEEEEQQKIDQLLTEIIDHGFRVKRDDRGVT